MSQSRTRLRPNAFTMNAAPRIQNGQQARIDTRQRVRATLAPWLESATLIIPLTAHVTEHHTATKVRRERLQAVAA